MTSYRLSKKNLFNIIAKLLIELYLLIEKGKINYNRGGILPW